MERNGAPMFLINLYNFFKSHHYDVQLISPMNGPNRSLCREYPCKIVYWDRINEHIQNDVGSTETNVVVFCNTIVNDKYVNELVNLNSTGRLKIKLYWVIHEYGIMSNHHFDHSLLYKVTRMVCICHKQQELIKQLSPECHSIVIYNGLNFVDAYAKIYEPIDELTARFYNDINDSYQSVYIALMGYLNKRNNQQAFINEVYYRLVQHYAPLNKHIKLTIIGNFEKTLYFASANKHMVINPTNENIGHINNLSPTFDQGFSDHILITGMVHNPLKYLRRSNIYVSYSNDEVIPLSILEAMYCGLPIVSTVVGGVNEMITDGHDGLLFEPNDADKCYELLCKCIDDSAYSFRLGTHARKTLADKFDESQCMANYIELVGPYTN